jgi:hydrogenase maturation factor HypE
LFEELVHQGGLAVVHVGDDGDVAQLVDHETYPEV